MGGHPGMTDAAYAVREGRAVVVLRLVTKAADKGDLCPSNTAICNAIDVDSPSSAARYIRILEERGLIQVRRFASFRVVRIVATGNQTAMPDHYSREPHWRDRDTLMLAPGAVQKRDRPCREPPLVNIAERIELDQTRLRAARERWLDVEVARYGLSSRGRFIDEMAA